MELCKIWQMNFVQKKRKWLLLNKKVLLRLRQKLQHLGFLRTRKESDKEEVEQCPVSFLYFFRRKVPCKIGHLKLLFLGFEKVTSPEYRNLQTSDFGAKLLSVFQL